MSSFLLPQFLTLYRAFEVLTIVAVESVSRSLDYRRQSVVWTGAAASLGREPDPSVVSH